MENIKQIYGAYMIFIELSMYCGWWKNNQLALVISGMNACLPGFPLLKAHLHIIAVVAQIALTLAATLMTHINPFLHNGIFHPYQLGELISILRLVIYIII